MCPEHSGTTTNKCGVDHIVQIGSVDPTTDINIVPYGMDSTADMYTILSGPY